MAYNPQNLKPFTSDQDREEAARNGRKGGIASGRAKRRKKAMRTAINEMLGEKAPDAFRKVLVDLGMDADDADMQAVVLAAMLKKAAGGSVQAFEAIVRLSGNDAELAQKKAELKERRREFDEDIALRRQIAEERKGGAGETSAWIDAVASEGYERDREVDANGLDC